MSKDTPTYAFVRRGNTLVPEMDMDIAALDGIAQNQRVKVEIKQWRSLPRLRAYWATLRDCIAATECAPTVDTLHKEIKLNVGLIERVRYKGMLVQIPASIALHELPEPDMIAYFQAAEKYLAEEYGFTGERSAVA